MIQICTHLINTKNTKVFVNGNWVGYTTLGDKLTKDFKNARGNGHITRIHLSIGIYLKIQCTSIVMKEDVRDLSTSVECGKSLLSRFMLIQKM